VEADFGGLGLSKQKFDPNFFGRTFSGVENGFYGDVTGRLGYSFGSALVYAKGGFAFFDGDAFLDNHLGGLGGGRARTSDFTGWTAGGGLEYLLREGWSVKLEYLHFDFGEQDAVLHTLADGNFRYSNELTADTLTVGVNYHFTPAYQPLK
jgi:opacity protein-like surface antigen